MRIAFLSDIHGNLVAFEAVLSELKKLSVDKTVFLGDAVGYGPWPSEVVSLLMESADVSVLGNHDAGVVGKIDISSYYDAVRYVLEWTAEQLSDEQINFMKNLNYISTNDEEDWLASHGSPRHPHHYEYLFDVRKVSSLYEIENYLKHVNFSGHSHTMQVFVMAERKSVVEIDLSSGSFDANVSSPIVCLAGSVGQPRDGDRRSSFALYDTETGLITFHRVSYNIDLVVNKIKSLKLPRSFADRLHQGY